MGRIGNPDGLLDFAGTHDRRHVLFVGRQTELDWLLTLAEKTRTAGPEPEDATGDTVMIHACPGMGKTALMDEFRRRAEDAGYPSFRLRHADLLSFEALCDRIDKELRAAAGRRTRAANIARTLAGDVAGMFGFRATAGAAGEAAAGLARPTTATPVVMTVDEAQNLDATHKTTVQCLHEAQLDWPILPVMAGLANTQDSLEQAGVSRLAEGRDLRLRPLSADEARLAFPAMCERYRVDLDSRTRKRWGKRIARDSLGFPQHLNIGLRAAAAELHRTHARPTPNSLRQVTAEAAVRRAAYYRQRLGGPLADHRRELAAVAALLSKGPAEFGPVEQTLREAANERRAQFNQPPMTFEESRTLLATALRKGVLERDDDVYELSIASMGDYLARYRWERNAVERRPAGIRALTLGT